AERWKYVQGFDHPLTKTLFQQGIFRDAYPINTEFYPAYMRKYKNDENKVVEILTDYIKNKEIKLYEGNEQLIETSPFSSNVTVEQTVGITISHTRESVKHGRLYSLNALAEGTIFNTTALIDENALK